MTRVIEKSQRRRDGPLELTPARCQKTQAGGHRLPGGPYRELLPPLRKAQASSTQDVNDHDDQVNARAARLRLAYAQLSIIRRSGLVAYPPTANSGPPQQIVLRAGLVFDPRTEGAA